MRNLGCIVAGIIILIAIFVGMSFAGTYNTLQQMDETVNSNWAQIDNQLKRRNDLIPNFVATVKGYAAHEKEVFTNIADARAKLAGALPTKNVNEISKNESELSGALSRLLVVVERYPELKADKSFIALQDELAGTENRIAVARRDYNESVKALNAKIRTFPTNIVAMISGIKSREYFEINETDKAVPEVKF